jgi:modulator of FtsH protease HflK
MSEKGKVEVIDLSHARNVTRVAGNVPKPVAVVIALVVVGVILLFSSFFQVNADSVGVVLRFGEVTRTVEPGLHMKMPLGIEQVHVVPTRRQLKQEFGFRTVYADERTVYSSDGYEEESLMLTGDLNVVQVQWTIQYRVEDAYDYLFRVRNVEDTLRFLSQAVMREIVGDRTVNEVLTVGRVELATTVQERLQLLSDRYEMGISINDVILQDVNPPDPVKPSFNEVNQAQQEMERKINEARRAYNAAVPRARGEAEQLVQQAEGYEINRVNRAEGQVARFRNLYAEYVDAPEITRQRIYLETMADVLGKVENKVIIDENAENVIPMMSSGGAVPMPLSGAAGGQ